MSVVLVAAARCTYGGHRAPDKHKPVQVHKCYVHWFVPARVCVCVRVYVCMVYAICCVTGVLRNGVWEFIYNSRCCRFHCIYVGRFDAKRFFAYTQCLSVYLPVCLPVYQRDVHINNFLSNASMRVLCMLEAKNIHRWYNSALSGFEIHTNIRPYTSAHSTDGRIT